MASLLLVSCLYVSLSLTFVFCKFLFNKFLSRYVLRKPNNICFYFPFLELNIEVNTFCLFLFQSEMTETLQMLEKSFDEKDCMEWMDVNIHFQKLQKQKI